MAGYITIGLGILCLGYYGVITAYAGITADFAWIWLLFAVLLSATGFSLRGHVFEKLPLHGRLLAAAAIVCVCAFAFLAGQVVSGMNARGRQKLPYVIVLGAQVKGDRPSRALRKRLQTAAAYWQENRDTVFILSGGQGPDEDISEAECMRRFLAEEGVPSSQLLPEEQSTSTRENLLYSRELMKQRGEINAPAGIITNNFHVRRAVGIAKKLGYEEVYGIAAPSDPVMQLHYVVREAFALLNEIRRGSIRLF